MHKTVICIEVQKENQVSQVQEMVQRIIKNHFDGSQVRIYEDSSPKTRRTQSIPPNQADHHGWGE